MVNQIAHAPTEKQQSNQQISVETGIQIIKQYKDTGYLTYDGALVLGVIGLFLTANIITNIINLVEAGETARKNITAYLKPDHFQDKEYIENILKDMLTTSHSDRVCLGIFHNGSNWGNLHFTKMSVKYEARRQGIESVKNILKDIDIERISEEIKAYSEEEFRHFSIEDSNLSPGCIIYLDNLGIKSVWSRLLSSKESISSKLLSKFIKPKEVGVYAILEIQSLSEESKENSYSADTEQKLEDLYKKLLWAVDRVRRGKKVVGR